MQYRVNELDSHTWLIEEYNETNHVYMYLIEGSERAVLIDTGFGGIDLAAVCRSLTSLPVTVILTHGHADHIGGTGAFEHVYLSKSDYELYRLHSKNEVRRIFSGESLAPVKKEIEFLDNQHIFQLGERTLEIIPVPGHSLGSVCILDKEKRRLFTGDSCCRANVLFQLPYAGTLSGYRNAMAHLWDRRNEYDITWPSHHAKPVAKEIIQHFIRGAELLEAGGLENQTCESPFGQFQMAKYGETGFEFQPVFLENDREVLTVAIDITDCMEVTGNTGSAWMILFTGSSACENFYGKVLDGGVDTQKERKGHPRSLSARYILEGVDKEMQPCHIFIENNGIADANGFIHHTVPRIFTDSNCLAWMETADLSGIIEPRENGVMIRIFTRKTEKLSHQAHCPRE